MRRALLTTWAPKSFSRVWLVAVTLSEDLMIMETLSLSRSDCTLSGLSQTLWSWLGGDLCRLISQ